MNVRREVPSTNTAFSVAAKVLTEIDEFGLDA